MLRRLVVPALLLTLAGACASGGAPDPTTQDRPVLVDDGQMLKTTDMPSALVRFDAPATKVWTALAIAYKSLGIEVAVNDARAHRMGNTNFYRNRMLNGVPLSKYVDCGNSPSGLRANTSRVYFSVITTLTAPDAGHTTLATDVRPVAVDESGTTASRTNCGSTGQLEKTLYDVVRRELGN